MAESLTEVIDKAEEKFQRQLDYTELGMVTRMHSAGKDASYILSVLEEHVPEPEQVTTLYEATLAGPQDITHMQGRTDG